jgi:DNA transposition AAA+ family ATPase
MNPATTIIDPTQDSGLISAQHNTNYNISPDQFEAVISNLLDDQQDILRYWFFLGKERDLSLTKLAKLCGVSSTTLSRVFRGKYGAGLDDLCETLERARGTVKETVDNPDFIPTAISKQMFAVFDRTRELRTVSFMSGPMGTGKTVCAEEYKRLNNHGKTTYYRCEPGLTFVQFVTEIARACNVGGKKQTHLRLREKLYRVHGAGNRLLIIDEFHELFLKRGRNDATPVMQCEFIRALHDISGGAISIISTDALQQHLLDNSEALAQLLDRGTMNVKLPGKPTKDDLRLFIKRFGLPDPTGTYPEASEIIKDILTGSGLRKLTHHLRDGVKTANKLKEPFRWDHFVTAFKDINSMSKAR